MKNFVELPSELPVFGKPLEQAKLNRRDRIFIVVSC